MKQITLYALLLATTFSFGQTDRTGKHLYLTDNLVLDEVIKTPNRMVWVNPLEIAYGKKQQIPDSVYVDLDPINKFYVDSESLKHIEAEHQYVLLAGHNLPYHMEAAKVLNSFYIRQWEVTNAEYRFFWESLSEVERAKMNPDTTCWNRDFYGASVDPLAQVYKSNPRYDDYPVVGVNYYQAKAFCKWYEDRLNSHHKLKDYRLEVDLPNQVEWAVVNQKRLGFWYNKNKKQELRLATDFCDYDYFTDLTLGLDTSLTSRALLPGFSSISKRNFIDDGYLFPAPGRSAKEIRKGSLKDEVKEVFYLNTNVSEWMSENYTDNWKPIYEWRQKTLRAIGTDDALLLADLEKYYNAANDTVSGQLVRGGNWYHEQHAYQDGVNVGTQSAKVFINPAESHATLGFRYVIRVIPLSIEDY